MKIFQKIMSWVLRSSLLLYVLGLIVYGVSVDQKKVDIKVLNYLRGSVRYVWQYSEGKSEYDEFKFVDAIEYYRRILKSMPFQKLTHGALAYCYYTFGERNKAITFFQKAIEENPSFFGYYYDLGLIYYKEGDWKKSADMLEKATALRIDSLIAYYSAISGKLFSDKVISNAWLKNRILMSKEIHEDMIRMIVLSYDAMEDYNSVFSVAASSLKVVEDSDGFFHFYAGKAAYALEKYEIAFQLFDQCIRIDENNAEAFEFKGLILAKMGNQRAGNLFRQRAKTMKKKNYIINREPIYFVPLYELGG